MVMFLAKLLRAAFLFLFILDPTIIGMINDYRVGSI